MPFAAKGISVLVLALSFSGIASAQAGGAGGGAAGGGTAGQGGAGMGTPNAGGETGAVPGASGASTMDKSGGTSHKQMKKGGMDAPASAGSTTKKTY
jgi:hypothetical protein